MNVNKLTIKQRLNLPTPIFWTNLGNTFATVSGVIIGIAGILKAYPAIPPVITTDIMLAAAVAGSIAKFLSLLAVDFTKVNTTGDQPVVVEPVANGTATPVQGGGAIPANKTNGIETHSL
jgi:hypothetical protein